MKRPGPAKPANKSLPKAPATVTPIAAKAAAKKADQPKVKAAKKAKAGKSTRASKPDSPKRGFPSVGALAKVSPEAKRFVSGTRNRRIAALAIVSAFAALGALILATMFTPLLAVQTLEVTGTSRIPKATIMKALQSQIGRPLPMVNSSEIAKALEPFVLVDSFATVSLPPHTLRIAITERQPICIVTVAGIDYLYDPAGVRVGVATSNDNYPRINIVGDPKGSPEYSAAIDVLLALPANLLGQISTVDAKSKDDVSMRLRGNVGQKIVWGDGSQSALKSKVLAALIHNQKKSDNVTFDVSSPTAPVVRYGNF